MEEGPFPAGSGEVGAGVKSPVPSPSMIVTSSEYWFATARSVLASPLRLAATIEVGPFPAGSGEVGADVKSPATPSAAAGTITRTVVDTARTNPLTRCQPIPGQDRRASPRVAAILVPTLTAPCGVRLGRLPDRPGEHRDGLQLPVLREFPELGLDHRPRPPRQHLQLPRRATAEAPDRLERLEGSLVHGLGAGGQGRPPHLLQVDGVAAPGTVAHVVPPHENRGWAACPLPALAAAL